MNLELINFGHLSFWLQSLLPLMFRSLVRQLTSLADQPAATVTTILYYSDLLPRNLNLERLIRTDLLQRENYLFHFLKNSTKTPLITFKNKKIGDFGRIFHNGILKEQCEIFVCDNTRKLWLIICEADEAFTFLFYMLTPDLIQSRVDILMEFQV
ncbi:hypothetical protein RJ641_024177 [Dillenia turbinata]|uniref:Uncharacterized protein n=1 Tax=Dillenia turbinata TaxID=194707 RepID=A0AAN8UDP3_9MAGN